MSQSRLARDLPSWGPALGRLRRDLEAGRLYMVAGRWHKAPCPAPSGRCSCLPRLPRPRRPRGNSTAAKRRRRAAELIAKAMARRLWPTRELRHLRRRYGDRDTFIGEVRRVVQARLPGGPGEEPRSVRELVVEFASGLSPDAAEAMLSNINPVELEVARWQRAPAGPTTAPQPRSARGQET